MGKETYELKKSIEERFKAWQKILAEKDARITALIDENKLLKAEISRKMLMRPALKDRIMGDVGRVTAQLRSELRKERATGRDLAARLESIKKKLDSTQAEVAAQTRIIEELKAKLKGAENDIQKERMSKKLEIERMGKEFSQKSAQELSDQKKSITAEFEEKLKSQAREAAAQIDALMNELAEAGDKGG